MKKSRASRVLTLVLTAATALIALPALAHADHRDRDRDRDRHAHARYARHVPVYHHGASCASRYHEGRRHDHKAHRYGHKAHRYGHKAHRYGHKAHRYDRREIQGHPYWCEPCSRRFGSWGSFRKHVHHHHHVSPWRLSGLLIRHGPLWVFLG